MDISIKISGLSKAMRRLGLTADKLGSMSQLWADVGMYVQKQTIKERFDREQTPDGQKWKSLAPSTIKHRKKRHKKGNMKILQDTGELRRSITYKAEDDKVKVGTNLKYARIHQFGGMITKKKGSVTIPARPFLGVNEEERKHIASMFRKYIKQHVLKE